MKELISIYISLFLIFSPLNGQTKKEATIYMTNGGTIEVKIIRIKKNTVKVKLLNINDKTIEFNIPKSKIYQIVLRGGKVLYRNPAFEEEFHKSFPRIENNQIEYLKKIQFTTQREFEKKPKWNINLREGDSYLNVALLGLKGDSLVISDVGITRTIYIGSIYTVISIAGNSKAKTGAKIGFSSGLLYGLQVVTNLMSEAESIVIPSILGLVVGGVFGAIGYAIGGSFEQDKIYDMSGWSIDSKRTQIRKIIEREK